MRYNQTNYLGLTVEVKYLGSTLVPTTVDICVIFFSKKINLITNSGASKLKKKKLFFDGLAG